MLKVNLIQFHVDYVLIIYSGFGIHSTYAADDGRYKQSRLG